MLESSIQQRGVKRIIVKESKTVALGIVYKHDREADSGLKTGGITPLLYLYSLQIGNVRFGLALATAPGVHLMAMSTTFHLIGVMWGNVYEPGVPAPLMSSYH